MKVLCMARDTVDDRPLESFEQMLEWFTEGCKPKADWRIGTEHEKFAFYTEDHSPVPYEGDRGIEALLKGMQAELGWTDARTQEEIAKTVTRLQNQYSIR